MKDSKSAFCQPVGGRKAKAIGEVQEEFYLRKGLVFAQDLFTYGFTYLHLRTEPSSCIGRRDRSIQESGDTRAPSPLHLSFDFLTFLC